MAQLSAPIVSLRGIGPKTVEIFHKHGIITLQDLLYFFPRAWIDASTVTPITELRYGNSALIKVRVVKVQDGFSQRTRIPYLRATVADESGSIEVMWFHAKYLKHKVKPGVDFLLYGKLQPQVRRTDGPLTGMMLAPKFFDRTGIVPVYPTIGGLPSTKIYNFVLQIKNLAQNLEDFIPEQLRQEYDLPSLAEAVCGMHFPESRSQIGAAQRRLGFDELLALVVPAMQAQHEREQETTDELTLGSEAVREWRTTLPFTLTGDQLRVIDEVLADLARPQPMNRLVQGDVGSGKTAVGLAAALQAVRSGKQVAWLAPTEILAQQHFATAQKLLGSALSTEESMALWTRTNHLEWQQGGEEKISVTELSSCPFVIGTHALLSEKVDLPNLGLLIIDEQHRFGVEQRARLRQLSGKTIHLLSMTATPIPRTMALLLYGDLRLSLIKEKPAGRREVTTRVVDEANRAKAFAFMDKHMEAGFQIYTICPTIEPAQDVEANLFSQLFESIDEKKAVATWFEKLKKEFPHRRVGMLHGKMKSKEKDTIMNQFRDHELDILVSTTVIEVGVDVPNATIMVIEDADRFGLAQLHQLRGRVGRGKQQSFCLLFASRNKTMSERLQILESTTDGFELAEKDLALRGPGELTGIMQSGLPNLRFASLEAEQVERVRRVADMLATLPNFQEVSNRLWLTYHPE